MSALVNHDEIRRIVRVAADASLADVNIIAINIHEDADEDGDEIVNVHIVFESRTKQLSAKDVADFLTRVRIALDEVSTQRSPIFSFIAKSELGKTRPESA